MIIAAHGNSLRALVKYLDNVSESGDRRAEHPDRHSARLRAGRRSEADPPLLPRRSRAARARPRRSPRKRARAGSNPRRVPTSARGPNAGSRKPSGRTRRKSRWRKRLERLEENDREKTGEEEKQANRRQERASAPHLPESLRSRTASCRPLPAFRPRRCAANAGTVDRLR